jgi:carbonic anhydrase/acetyltransferase-like protein (isoleucine patch superfamily)
MFKYVFRLIVRNPLRLLSFAGGWVLSLIYVDSKTHGLPILLETPGLWLGFIKGREAKLIINGTLIVDKRGASRPYGEAHFNIGAGGTLVINGTVTIGPGVQLCVAPDAVMIIGSRPDGSTTINQRTQIIADERVEIGSNCMLSWDILIMDTNAHNIIEPPTPRHAPILIKDDVWIGARATILKNVTIGQGAVVGAAAVVLKDVPEKSIAGGNPAKIIKENIRWG